MLTVQKAEDLLTDRNLESQVVDSILDHRTKGGKTEYLVKWKYFPDSDNSWESETHFDDIATIWAYWERINTHNKKGAHKRSKAKKAKADKTHVTTHPVPTQVTNKKQIVAKEPADPHTQVTAEMPGRTTCPPESLSVKEGHDSGEVAHQAEQARITSEHVKKPTATLQKSDYPKKGPDELVDWLGRGPNTSVHTGVATESSHHVGDTSLTQPRPDWGT